jgi:hypothetical protein
MIRSIRSAILFSDWSIVPHLPSYRKVFGDNLIPAEVIAVVAIIYIISAVYRFYKWSQLSLPDIDSLDDEKLSLSRWEKKPKDMIFSAGVALCVVQSLLFFMGIDSIESMALLRITFISISVIMSWMFVIVSLDNPNSSSSSSQRDIDLGLLLHFVWSLQTFLLPGLYALMGKAIDTRKLYLVYIIFWSNFLYTIISILCVLGNTEQKSTSNQEEKDGSTSSSAPTKAKEENIYQLRKKKFSSGIIVMALDVFISVFWYF